MTTQQIERIFQPFVQADTSTTRQYGGTGLGLVISKRLAEMLGGSLTVRSCPGQGSVFSVNVSTGSLAEVEFVQLAEQRRSISSTLTRTQQRVDLTTGADASSGPLNHRVLLAEDGPDNRKLISFLLKKAGADVTTAENGRIALETALQSMQDGTPFDVVLMDMQMPVLDGYEATHQLRQAGYRGPIIALTAHAMNSDREKCLAVGCDEYATKPIDRSQLISLVQLAVSYGFAKQPDSLTHVHGDS